MTSKTKPFQKILDPTKIGTWNIVRYPPIENKTVIQGKPREQNSNAFLTHRWKEGVRLRKALKAITHGKDIFVYHNLRTNQVVYSLTRYLEKNNVLRQLVYHGKKTIPSTLRKDMWVPYFSVHFHDSKIGLRAYHLLREFSMLRQLSPPREMITISERFLDQRRPRDPEQAKEFDEKYQDKLGWLMEKKDRARVLMDQKATSVADIAAVLAIQEEEVKNGFADGKRGYITQSARRRRREARKAAEHTAHVQSNRIADFEEALALSSNTNNNADNAVDYVVEDVERKTPVLQDGKGVKVLWTDLHYARFAQAWPDRVFHGELDLSRDHVMPGQKPIYDVEVLADGAFKEKQQKQQQVAEKQVEEKQGDA